jgi:hypothetical protein
MSGGVVEVMEDVVELSRKDVEDDEVASSEQDDVAVVVVVAVY